MTRPQASAFVDWTEAILAPSRAAPFTAKLRLNAIPNWVIAKSSITSMGSTIANSAATAPDSRPRQDRDLIEFCPAMFSPLFLRHANAIPQA